jgi:hypothetical protein
MQTLDFPCRVEQTTAMNVKMEPGDGTTYSFVVTLTDERHDWAPEEGPIVGVASVSGCMFGGQWMPISHVREWWVDTKDKAPGDSLSHYFIGWILGEQRPGVKTNLWTVRAALLAVLKTCGEAEE